jgi:hypothetical protein
MAKTQQSANLEVKHVNSSSKSAEEADAARLWLEKLRAFKRRDGSIDELMKYANQSKCSYKAQVGRSAQAWVTTGGADAEHDSKSVKCKQILIHKNHRHIK